MPDKEQLVCPVCDEVSDSLERLDFVHEEKEYYAMVCVVCYIKAICETNDVTKKLVVG